MVAIHRILTQGHRIDGLFGGAVRRCDLGAHIDRIFLDLRCHGHGQFALVRDAGAQVLVRIVTTGAFQGHRAADGHTGRVGMGARCAFRPEGNPLGRPISVQDIRQLAAVDGVRGSFGDAALLDPSEDMAAVIQAGAGQLHRIIAAADDQARAIDSDPIAELGAGQTCQVLGQLHRECSCSGVRLDTDIAGGQAAGIGSAGDLQVVSLARLQAAGNHAGIGRLGGVVAAEGQAVIQGSQDRRFPLFIGVGQTGGSGTVRCRGNHRRSAIPAVDAYVADGIVRSQDHGMVHPAVRRIGQGRAHIDPVFQQFLIQQDLEYAFLVHVGPQVGAGVIFVVFRPRALDQDGVFSQFPGNGAAVVTTYLDGFVFKGGQIAGNSAQLAEIHCIRSIRPGSQAGDLLGAHEKAIAANGNIRSPVCGGSIFHGNAVIDRHRIKGRGSGHDHFQAVPVNIFPHPQVGRTGCAIFQGIAGEAACQIEIASQRLGNFLVVVACKRNPLFFHSLQLGHVHRIRILGAGCQVGNLAGIGFRLRTDLERPSAYRHSTCGRGPYGIGLVRCFAAAEIAGYPVRCTCLGTHTQSHAATGSGTGRSTQCHTAQAGDCGTAT